MVALNFEELARKIEPDLVEVHLAILPCKAGFFCLFVFPLKPP